MFKTLERGGCIMPVIINEFEVLAEEPERPKSHGYGMLEQDEQEEEEEAEQKAPAPHDIVLVMRHWQARLARLRAY
jgi:hypothetical protein